MLRLYTDESPGLKVDPMVIMFLSLGFIFSVVALHCEYRHIPAHQDKGRVWKGKLMMLYSNCEGHKEILIGFASIVHGSWWVGRQKHCFSSADRSLCTIRGLKLEKGVTAEYTQEQRVDKCITATHQPACIETL